MKKRYCSKCGVELTQTIIPAGGLRYYISYEVDGIIKDFDPDTGKRNMAIQYKCPNYVEKSSFPWWRRLIGLYENGDGHGFYYKVIKNGGE